METYGKCDCHDVRPIFLMFSSLFMFIAFSYYLFEVSFLGSNHDDIKIILHKQQIYLSLFSKIALPKIQTKTGLFSVTNSNIFGSTTNSENWHHCVFFMLFPFFKMNNNLWDILQKSTFVRNKSIANCIPTALISLLCKACVK